MKLQHAWLALSLVASLSTHAWAATFTDDFEGGSNQAGWTFIPGGDLLESSGGNPGWWLHQPQYDTFDPAVQSSWANDNPFKGDYTLSGVSRISFDLINHHMDFGDGSGFNVVLLLRNTHGTPNDVDDDDFAYFIGPNVPLVGAGWQHYEVDVPSLSSDPVPAGWSGGWVGDCAAFRPGVTWNDVVSSVDRVEIHWLEPCNFAIFQQWNVGVDNLSVEYVDQPVATERGSWGAVKRLYRP